MCGLTRRGGAEQAKTKAAAKMVSFCLSGELDLLFTEHGPLFC